MRVCVRNLGSDRLLTNSMWCSGGGEKKENQKWFYFFAPRRSVKCTHCPERETIPSFISPIPDGRRGIGFTIHQSTSTYSISQKRKARQKTSLFDTLYLSAAVLSYRSTMTPALSFSSFLCSYLSFVFVRFPLMSNHKLRKKRLRRSFVGVWKGRHIVQLGLDL